MMSNYSTSTSIPTVTSQPGATSVQPGGIQYDPRTNAWSDFTLSDNYRWGDVSNTFALFTWPNTTVPHQVNIAQANNGTVSLGMLKKNDDGSSTFVNAASWILDPNIHGYPTKLAFGKDSIYQFGSIVSDNRTGAFRSLLTRIPSAAQMEVYSVHLQTFQFMISAISAVITATNLPADVNPFSTKAFFIKDIGARNVSINSTNKYQFLVTNLFQPICGGENSSVWGYDPGSPQIGMSLDPLNFGNYGSIYVPVNITDAFGDLDNVTIDEPSNVVLYAVIGVILSLMLAVFILVWRDGFKIRTRIWPRWKRKIKAKIIESVSKIDDGNGDKTKVGESDDGSTINKIEEIPMQAIDMDEGHKILVTPDMDLSDVDAGYMQGVNLEHHPRPTIVISLSTSSILGGNYLNDSTAETLVPLPSSENSQRLLPSNLSIPSAPQLSTFSETTIPSSIYRYTDPSEHQEQYATPSEDTEDYAPPYIHADDVSMLPNPSFLSPALPSAPPLDAESSNVQLGSGLREYDDTRGGSSR
ncbi:hypothetical protein BGX26_005616 [Mortierella sp. AD094]|nr:hypothetical protein BGX26_005616 [Mortierella sp. AD094]